MFRCRAQLCLVGAALSCCTPVMAEPLGDASRPLPAVAAPGATPPELEGTPGACCHVPAGTVVNLAIVEAIDSKTYASGNSFTIKLVEPVRFAGKIVLPAGLTGKGEVVHAAKARAMGKAGELILAGRHLSFGTRTIALRGMRMGGIGRDNSGLVLASTIAVGMAGLIISGGERRVAAGSPAHARIAEDLLLPPLPETGSPTMTPPDAPNGDPSVGTAVLQNNDHTNERNEKR